MLPLVLVQTFDLRVENCSRIHLQANLIFKHLSKNLLIVLFDRHEFFLKGRIISDFLQASEQIKFSNPFRTHDRTD